MKAFQNSNVIFRCPAGLKAKMKAFAEARMRGFFVTFEGGEGDDEGDCGVGDLHGGLPVADGAAGLPLGILG